MELTEEDVRRICREELEAALANRETKLTLRVVDEDLRTAISASTLSTRDTGGART